MNGYAISSPQALSASRAKMLFPEAYKTFMLQEADGYYETGPLWPAYDSEAAERHFAEDFTHIIDDRGVYCLISPSNSGDFSLEWCPWEKNDLYPLGLWFFLAEYEFSCCIELDPEVRDLNETNAGLVRGKSVR